MSAAEAVGYGVVDLIGGQTAASAAADRAEAAVKATPPPRPASARADAEISRRAAQVARFVASFDEACDLVGKRSDGRRMGTDKWLWECEHGAVPKGWSLDHRWHTAAKAGRVRRRQDMSPSTVLRDGAPKTVPHTARTKSGATSLATPDGRHQG